MRDILFHGKRVDNGEWVEGFYVHLLDGKGRESHRIYTGYAETDCGDFYPDWYEVDPDTVGQYTGLTDKNGKKIFEGDIVDIGEMICTVNGQYLVVYSTTNHCWALERSVVHHHHYFTFSDLNGFAESCEVIGNIHDNPELLEGGVAE